jgi:hypothetical protein
MEIPDEQLPMRADIYRDTVTLSDGGDWVGPINASDPTIENLPCLIAWKSALYERLPMGDYSDDSATIFTKPDVDIEIGDRIEVEIGGVTHKFVIENLPRVFLHPPTWEPHHKEAGLKEWQ